MANGTTNNASTVVSLFSQRLCGVFNTRLTRCSERLNRDLQQGFGETILVRSLLDARRNLTILYRVALIESFPVTVREHLQSQLKRFAERTQESLEASCRDDRVGHTQGLIRNNSLLRYDAPIIQPIITTSPLQSMSDHQPGGIRKRNILV